MLSFTWARTSSVMPTTRYVVRHLRVYEGGLQEVLNSALGSLPANLRYAGHSAVEGGVVLVLEYTQPDSSVGGENYLMLFMAAFGAGLIMITVGYILYMLVGGLL